jgi:hypothetical protein
MADSLADAERFVRRVIASETVWYLDTGDGAAWCESIDPSVSEETRPVLLFFSDRAYARRVQTRHFPECGVAATELFLFLYQWLHGMTGDGVLAGPNWTGDMIGLELKAYPLRATIEETMTEEHRRRCRQRYPALKGKADPGE